MSLIASCHCGATSIELSRPPAHARECNCSYCARTGAVWGYYGREDMHFLSQHGDRIYSASGGVNQHHFCEHCGMQTWGDSPDWASMYNSDGTPKTGDASAIPTARSYAVNLRLIDDLDWSTLAVEKIDGKGSW